MVQQQGHITCALLLSLLTFLSVHLVYVQCLCAADDSRVLLALKAIDEPPPLAFEFSYSEERLIAMAKLSTDLSSWEEGSDCCHGWAGVTCDPSNTHVAALNFRGLFQLKKVMAKEVCELRGLQILNVSVDQVYGSGDIPDCLWNMAELEVLIVSAWRDPETMIDQSSYYRTCAEIGAIAMQGSIPAQSSYWRTGAIAMQGSLPAQVCNLQHLTHLDVGGLQFENSTIPDCLWSMTQLQYLTLQGKFSPQVCGLRHLIHLDASNSIEYSEEAPIPPCIWGMTGLEFLRLVGFDEASSLPSDVCNIKNLAHLDLTGSHLQGNPPSCLQKLTKLEHLTLGTFSSRLSLLKALLSDICSSLQNLSNRYLSLLVGAAV